MGLRDPMGGAKKPRQRFSRQHAKFLSVEVRGSTTVFSLQKTSIFCWLKITAENFSNKNYAIFATSAKQREIDERNKTQFVSTWGGTKGRVNFSSYGFEQKLSMDKIAEKSYNTLHPKRFGFR